MLDEFMKRVEFEPNTGCWLWSNAPGAGGYGTVRYDGRDQKAHRVSWALHRGYMPPRDIKVCHRCDTPPCVNPDHLWLGTQADNVADMMAKGRHRAVGCVGSENPMSALTEDDVWAIRGLIRQTNIPQAKIGKMFGVSQMTISRISTYATWPHVHMNWPFNPLPIYTPQEQVA